MPYDAKLADRMDALLSRDGPTERKKMFGGICYLSNGNMFSGIYREWIILRLGERGAAEALKGPHAHPMDITGKPMRGWIMVEPEGFRTDDELAAWLAEAREFAATLPGKAKTSSPGRRKQHR